MGREQKKGTGKGIAQLAISARSNSEKQTETLALQIAVYKCSLTLGHFISYDFRRLGFGDAKQPVFMRFHIGQMQNKYYLLVFVFLLLFATNRVAVDWVRYLSGRQVMVADTRTAVIVMDTRTVSTHCQSVQLQIMVNHLGTQKAALQL